MVNLVEDGGITGAAIVSEYSYTKAICSEDECQDYKIVCEENTLISKTPITGASIKIDQNWQDPRDQETIDSFCDLK